MRETKSHLKRKIYKLNKFQVKPSKGSYTHDIFIIYFLNKNIGYFNSKKPILVDKNGTENFFLIHTNLGKRSERIGTISFLFNDNRKWGINYVTIDTIPEHLLTIRKVLIEKNKLWILQH